MQTEHEPGRPSLPVSVTQHRPSGAQHQPAGSPEQSSWEQQVGCSQVQGGDAGPIFPETDGWSGQTGRVGLSDMISKPLLPASRPTVSPASRALPSEQCARRSQISGLRPGHKGSSQERPRGSAMARRSPAFRRPFRELLSFVLILLFLHNPECLEGRSWHRAKGMYRTDLGGDDAGGWAPRGRRGQWDKTPRVKAQ